MTTPLLVWPPAHPSYKHLCMCFQTLFLLPWNSQCRVKKPSAQWFCTMREAAKCMGKGAARLRGRRWGARREGPCPRREHESEPWWSNDVSQTNEWLCIMFLEELCKISKRTINSCHGKNQGCTAAYSSPQGQLVRSLEFLLPLHIFRKLFEDWATRGLGGRKPGGAESCLNLDRR